MSKIEKIKNTIKDAAKLKLVRGDDSIRQWGAHGATELANMLLHGHPAPVYAGNQSPPDQLTNEPVAQVESPVGVQPAAAEPDRGIKSYLFRKLDELRQQPEMNEPEMELEQ